MLRVGQGYFTPDRPDLKVGRHPWFVISDPAQPQIVIANLSTFREEYADLGCVLSAPEHSSLSRRSLLRCDEARLAEAAAIEGLISSHFLSETQDATPQLLAKLRGALCGSPHTPNNVKALMISQGLCGSVGHVPPA